MSLLLKHFIQVSDEELLEIEEEFLSSKPQLEFYLKVNGNIESLCLIMNLVFLCSFEQC